MANIREVAVWVLGTGSMLVFAGMLIACRDSGDSLRGGAQSSKELNQSAVRLVDYLLADDVNSALLTGRNTKDGLSVSDLLGLVRLDWQTTARRYEAEYDSNEIAADNDYKGKRILLSGTVDSVEKDFTGTGLVILRGSNPIGVRAELSEHGMGGAASFRKGQQVNIVCEGKGSALSIAMLDNCEPLEDYLNRLSPSIDSMVKQFLTGKRTFVNSMATPLTTMYVAGQYLPPDSPCMNGKMQSCRAELAALFKDPVKSGMIRNQTKQLMSSLKVN